MNLYIKVMTILRMVLEKIFLSFYKTYLQNNKLNLHTFRYSLNLIQTIAD